MNWSGKQISIVSVVAATSFMGTFLISSVNIALPAIEKEFGLDAVTLSWVVTSFLLAAAIFLLPAGRLGDITGVRGLFKTGVVIFTISSLVCGFSGSGMWLIIFRFLQGLGGSLTATTGPAILVSAFPPQQRGRVLGISVSAVYLGLATGPFAGGLITQYIDWRAIFYVASALGVITTFLAFIYLGKDEPEKGVSKKLNLGDSILYMIGLVALVYGSSQIPKVIGWSMLAGGSFALVVFWILESRSTSPVIETKLFTGNRLFAYSNIAALINYSATYAIVFLLSLYLQKIHKLSPRDAGMILIAQPIMMTLFSPVAGRLSDKVQPRFLATAGMTLCATGLASFALLTKETPAWLMVVQLMWVGLGFAMFSSPNMNTIMSSVAKHQYGLASGTAATMRVLGQIFSMTIATLFFAGIIGNQVIEKVPDDLFMKAVKMAFLIFAAISTIGIYFSYSRGKVERD